jgi:L-ascorbate metabolism protein UlaG (beta-lactamase superfamily)
VDKLNVKVEHIFHSGFTVETENFLLVFDYYQGDISLKNKKTIIFSSHSHSDHFNPEILKWSNIRDDINYVFSSDIEIIDSNKRIYKMDPYESLTLDSVNIKTFGSTDMGVSFFVSVDGINIFHAGDLNWWYWNDDTEEEKISMEKSFKEEIKKIEELNIDISFFPVDPRLEDAFSFGGEYFIKIVKPKYLFPMHFGDKFHASSDFIHKIKDINTKIVEITHRNQIINL